MISACTSVQDDQEENKAAQIEFGVPTSKFEQAEPSRDPNERPADRKQKTQKETEVVVLRSPGGLAGGMADFDQPIDFPVSEPLTIAAENMPVGEFVHLALGELLQLNYVVDDELARSRKTVSLNIQQPLPPDQFYRLTLSTLRDGGIEVITKQNIFYVRKAKGRESVATESVGVGRSIDSVPEAAGQILQIIPLQYETETSVRNVIQKLTKLNLWYDNKQKLLVVQGDRSDVVKAVKVVNMLDVPSAQSREIRVFKFVYISPNDFIAQVQPILESEGLKVGPAEDVNLMGVGRLNATVLFARHEDIVSRVEYWARQLDVPEAGDKPRFFLFRPQYNSAENLDKSLQKFLPALSGEAITGAVVKSPTEGTTRVATGQATTIVSLDEDQNALIFYTEPEKYRQILPLLEQLDRLPGQVALDVAVAEITLSGQLSRGVRYFLDTQQNADSSQVILDLVPGNISFSAITGDWQAFIDLVNRETTTQLLSNPHLLVRDGESATINSGDQIPVLTQTSTSDVSDKVTNSVQYRSTGVTLQVTPTINADGIVSLDISQEVSNSKPTEDSEIDSPTITNRSLRTKVLARDGQTVILGGLINEDQSETESKLPILGDIPGLGLLFSSKSQSTTRTELVVLITPRILYSTNDVDSIGTTIRNQYSFPIGTPAEKTDPGKTQG